MRQHLHLLAKKMCKLQMLRTLVEQRLTVAAEEIFVLFERAIAEYDEELSRRIQEYERQLQLQDVASKSKICVREEVNDANQEDAEQPDVKEEEEVWSSGQPEIPLTLVLVKTEDVKSATPADGFSQPHTDSTPQSFQTKNVLMSMTGERLKKLRPRPFDCDVCHKSFTGGVGLGRHACSHTGDKPSGPKSFRRRRASLTPAGMAAGEKPFACTFCGMRFTQNSNLLRHARTHSGDKPYQCDVCGRRFSDKRYIGVHMRTHTGEKPFPCSACGRKFSDKRHVMKHMSMHAEGQEAGSEENSAFITMTLSSAGESNTTE